MNHPPPISPPPSRFTLRYGYLICKDCHLTSDYCACQAAEQSTANDGEATMLEARIAEVVRQRAGR